MSAACCSPTGEPGVCRGECCSPTGEPGVYGPKWLLNPTPKERLELPDDVAGQRATALLHALGEGREDHRIEALLREAARKR